MLAITGEIPYNGPQWSPDYLQKLEKGWRLERPPLANTDMYEKYKIYLPQNLIIYLNYFGLLLKVQSHVCLLG